jgi:riboflavin kinase/FMN adenylyltransferase
MPSSDENAEVVSSSRVREALAAGDVAAAGLLGYRYAVSAEIQHGQEARPDAGLPDSQHGAAARNRAQPGIYAVRFRRPMAFHDGVASFGRRPTVDQDGAALLLETYPVRFFRRSLR